MNVVESFRDWMAAEGYATPGQDLYISRAPKEPSELYWLKLAGGQTQPTPTGYRSSSVILVYFRSEDPEVVYNTLAGLREDIEAGNVTLEGYELIRAQTDGPHIDEDLDAQEREVGLLQVTLNTYQGGE